MRVLTKYISETLLETFLQSTSFEFYSIYKAKLTTFNLNFGTAWHCSAPACILMSGPHQGPKVHSVVSGVLLRFFGQNNEIWISIVLIVNFASL